jgi:hypothetical protein
MPDKSRERALEEALLNLSEKWRYEIGQDCWLAVRFRRMINPKDSDYRGGVWTVRHLLYNREASGFRRLRNHPALTVESLVLKGEWDDIFDEHDKRAAKKHLGEN